MVLIQEMALKVDQGFLGAITALFTPTADPEAERKWVIFIFGEYYERSTILFNNCCRKILR